MAKFEAKGDKLYIDGKKVLRGWESFSGWYWFATKKLRTQDSDMGNGTVIKNDTIWYGLVQGFEEEWGDFSEGVLKCCGNKVWKIPKINLPFSGRRTPRFGIAD